MRGGKYLDKSFPVFFRHCPLINQDYLLENIWPSTYASGNVNSLRFFWTDIYLLRDGRWQIVAAQDMMAPVTDKGSEGGLFNLDTLKK